MWGMNKYSKCLQLLLLLQLPGLEMNKVCAVISACVWVWEAERNTVWALLGSEETSNKKHILQAARELFLPSTFTSPQAANCVVQVSLRLIIYSTQGLSCRCLAALQELHSNVCSGGVRGMRWAHGIHGGLSKALLAPVNTELLSPVPYYTGVKGRVVHKAVCQLALG